MISFVEVQHFISLRTIVDISSSIALFPTTDETQLTQTYRKCILFIHNSHCKLKFGRNKDLQKLRHALVDADMKRPGRHVLMSSSGGIVPPKCQGSPKTKISPKFILGSSIPKKVLIQVSIHVSMCENLGNWADPSWDENHDSSEHD